MNLGSGTPVPGIRRVAVVGGGAAGLFSACLLDPAYEVTLIEKDEHIGGHACAAEVPDGPDAGTRLDAGFINCAYTAYPRLFAYFATLGIETEESDASFCAYDEGTGDQYVFSVGSQGRARAAETPDPRTFRYLNKLARFYARAAEDLAAGALAGLTVGEYCARLGVSRKVVQRFLVPVYSSLWVMPPAIALDLSAESVYRFYRRVGLPSLKDYNTRFVKGSSRTYIDALRRRFGGRLRLACPIKTVLRDDSGVELVYQNGERERFDAVVMAVHADSALALLAQPTDDERRLLGPWRYPATRAVIHSDRSVIPAGQKYLAAWNYVGRARPEDRDRVTIHYYLNRIMNLDVKRDYFVTLNPATDIDPATILLDKAWTHPFFSVPAVATQLALPELQGRRRTYLCGSYFSCGSHEDAVNSAEAACRALGVVSTVKSWEAPNVERP